MKFYSVDDASAVLFQSAEIVGEAPAREEAVACLRALHDFRTARLDWAQMQAVIDSANVAAAASPSPLQNFEQIAPGLWPPAPPDVTQSLIAIGLAQYELSLQEAYATGTQQMEARWHQEHIGALDRLNQEYARGVAAEAAARPR